ncbi:hypothetical protein ALP02_200180 [Pseudomonas coronafaciens pv. garcae]|nr:hypothetical protein ALP02_200180 [Pseudomonas coronafaciens pv. garcae]
MQGAGDQFLAGARFALDQHVGVGRRHFADLAIEVQHRRAGADNADLAVVILCRTFFGSARFGECAALVLQALDGLPIAQDARNCLQHFVVIEGFGDVIHRAHLHRIDGRAQAGVTGHDQHRFAFAQLDQFGARSARQSKVADDQVKRGDAETFLSFLNRAGFTDFILVALKQATQG